MIAPASFHRTIAVTDLFNLPQQQEALARLKYVISSKGFGVFTGSPGTGKSSMVRFLESSLDKARYLFCYINDADLNFLTYDSSFRKFPIAIFKLKLNNYRYAYNQITKHFLF